jgi:hypothetical protein
MTPRERFLDATYIRLSSNKIMASAAMEVLELTVELAALASAAHWWLVAECWRLEEAPRETGLAALASAATQQSPSFPRRG